MKTKLFWGLSGLLLGTGLTWFFSTPSNPNPQSVDPTTNESKTVHKAEEKKLKYINPLADKPEFRSMYFDEMIGFKAKVNQVILNTKKDHKNYHISFFFKDMVNGTQVGYNEREKFVPASLMKVPVLIALLKLSEEKPSILNRTVKVMESSEYEKSYAFSPGQNMTLLKLAKIMIQYSDNRAALTIIDAIGIENVNKVEEDLRLRDTEVEAGFYDNVIGVKTYATVFRTLYNASYLSEENSDLALDILSHTNYGNGIRRAIPEDVEVAHKFGIRKRLVGKEYKVEQLHHFALVYRKEKVYLIGIMIKGDDKATMQKCIEDISHEIDQEIVSRIEIIKSEHLPADTR